MSLLRLRFGAPLGLTIASLAAASCGGEPPPPAVAPTPTASAAPPVAPPPDVSAVPAPEALVVSGRVASASAILAVARPWAKLPMPGSEQVSELITSEAVGPVVDLDQPIDFAVAVSGSGLHMQPLAAISAAVKDPDKVRAAFAERYKLVPGDHGATLVTGLGKGRHEDPDDADEAGGAARTCELAPAFGAAPVRLVCGWGKAALRELGPWLTRTVPRTAPVGDVHVDVRMEPLRATLMVGKGLAGALFGGALGTLAPSARGLAAAIGGDVADFASDLDTATLDVAFAPAGVDAKARLRLTGHASTLGQIATAHADRSGPAPAALWQMPADADFAFFDRGVDDGPVTRARELTATMIDGGLDALHVPAADAKAVGAAFGKLMTGAAMVYASGVDLDAVRAADQAARALGHDAPPAKVLEASRAESQALLGWRLGELDQPAAPVNAALRELGAALARGSVVTALRAHDRSAGAPQLKAAAAVRAPGLPPGTLHWTLEVPREQPLASKPDPKKPAPPARPVTWHVLVAPSGGKSWVAVGGDETALASRLATALGSPAGGLAGRPEIGALKDAKVGAAWILTPTGLLDAGLSAAAGGGEPLSRTSWGTLDALTRTPNKGQGAAVVTVTSEPSERAAGATLEIRVSRAAIEDVVTEMIRQGGW